MPKYDTSHGSPYDRGRADAYYGRQLNPHLWLDGMGRQVVTDLTKEQREAYYAGHDEEADVLFDANGDLSGSLLRITFQYFFASFLINAVKYRRRTRRLICTYSLHNFWSCCCLRN